MPSTFKFGAKPKDIFTYISTERPFLFGENPAGLYKANNLFDPSDYGAKTNWFGTYPANTSYVIVNQAQYVDYNGVSNGDSGTVYGYVLQGENGYSVFNSNYHSGDDHSYNPAQATMTINSNVSYTAWQSKYYLQFYHKNFSSMPSLTDISQNGGWDYYNNLLSYFISNPYSDGYSSSSASESYNNQTGIYTLTITVHILTINNISSYSAIGKMKLVKV